MFYSTRHFLRIVIILILIIILLRYIPEAANSIKHIIQLVSTKMSKIFQELKNIR